MNLIYQALYSKHSHILIGHRMEQSGNDTLSHNVSRELRAANYDTAAKNKNNNSNFLFG